MKFSAFSIGGVRLRPGMTFGLALLVLFALIEARAAELEIVTATAREAPRIFRLDGVAEAVHKTTVSAQISGQVEAVLFDVDDYVEKDQIIVRLNDKQPAAKLEQARAELDEARARLEEAEEEYQRVKGVFEKKAVSQKAMDAADAGLKAAQARLKVSRAGLEQAREQYEYTRVRAPYSGIVTERHVEVGETAQPGMKLMSGLSLEKLRVNVDVPQNMINSVRASEKVSVETPRGERIPVPHKTVFPFAEPASHTFRVRLDLEGDNLALFPGMFVKVLFEVGQQAVLTVPTESIVRRSEVTAVYVSTPEGRLSMRAIRAGRELDDGYTVVLAGLLEGERVALDPIAAAAQLKRQYGSKAAH